MRDEKLFELINDCHEIVANEPVCLNFPVCDKQLVTIPDTHGDFRTAFLIIEKYLSDPQYIFIFLGDELDRETSSLLPDQNIIYLLTLKRKFPNRFYFLLGNHSLNPFSKKYPEFHPCSFWLYLSSEHRSKYEFLFNEYAFLATTANGVIMTHSTLPLYNDMPSYNIEDTAYQECLWADYKEDVPEHYNVRSMRPAKYRDEFEHSMHQWEKSLLIRGHDPNADLTMFDGKCCTMQASRAFSKTGICDRRIAIVDLSKDKIDSASDIEILNIENNFKSEKV